MFIKRKCLCKNEGTVHLGQQSYIGSIPSIYAIFPPIIIYMKKFLHFDSLRAVQFFSKTVQKRVNSVQKEETNLAFWLVNDQRNLQMANQIFCFQIKCTPWMTQYWWRNYCSLIAWYTCFSSVLPFLKFVMYFINK